MGVKAIAVWLNERGYRTRGGATWGLGPVHAMLSHPVYAGRMRFNRSEARSRRRKSDSEQVFADVPAIVELQVFERVQSLLKERNPPVTPPRMVSGPILLPPRKGAMTLRTGTSKTGKVHRYYSCSSCVRQGKTACNGRSIRMDKLDTRRARTSALAPGRNLTFWTFGPPPQAPVLPPAPQHDTQPASPASSAELDGNSDRSALAEPTLWGR